MARISSLFVLAAVTLASGAAVASNPTDLGPSNANCTRSTYPITVTSSNIVFSKDITTIPAGVDAATFLTSINEEFIASLPTPEVFIAKYENNGALANVTGTYHISGTLCTPKNSSAVIAPDTVQLLIHGAAYDSRYWDFRGSGVPENYSYVYAAAEAGLITFRYDRLGTGLSDHPSDAYNVVQGPTDVAIASELARKLRSGGIGSTAFKTIVTVGHSYGSSQSTALIQAGLVDHGVLTGFTADTSGIGLFLAGGTFSPARDVFPDKFGQLPPAYLVTATPQSAQIDFLHFPNYTPAAANLSRATEEPTAHGAFLALGAIGGRAPNFNGSIAVVTGEADFPFCSGNCSLVPAGSNLTDKLDTVKALYPAVAPGNFKKYMPKGTGHGNQIHITALEANRWIQDHIASL